MIKHHPARQLVSESVLSTGETVVEFETRLKKEGRFGEYKQAIGAMAKAEHLKFHTIRKREANNWRPLKWAGDDAAEAESKTTWGAVRWAVEALGLHESGTPVGMHQAPSKESWSLFNWGRRAPEKLYNLWVNLGLKRDNADDDSRKAKMQVEEIDAMLAEIASDEVLQFMRTAKC